MAQDPRDPDGTASGGWLPPDQPGGPPASGVPGGAPASGPGGPQPPPQNPQAPYGPGWGQPGYGAPYAGSQPPPYGQPQQYGTPYAQGSPWASTYYYTYAEPSNTPGMAGFIMSLSSIGALVFFLGILSPLTLGVSIASTIVSRNGIRKVERGETRRNHDVARWGYWLGILGIVLSILAAAAWIALIAASDPDTWDDTTPRDRGEPVEAAIRLAGAALRLLGGL